MNNYIDQICSTVEKARQNKAEHTLIFEGKKENTHLNEFILFIKPNITINEPGIKLDKIVSMVMDKVSDFGLTINMIKVLPGKYLKKHNVMANHYGVINKLSKNVREEITEQGKEKFKEIFGLDFDGADIYGGHEFLEKFPKFTPYALSVLWQSAGFKKLVSGTYAGKYTFDGHDHYIVNGFHPRQLNHFNLDGRSIVVFSLSGDLNWASARNDLIGLTDPSQAKKGSIRHELLVNQKDLGIPIMNTAYNGVHLSAGPIEALNEMIRFCSDYGDSSKILGVEDFKAGKLLLENFSPQQVRQILDNDKIIHGEHTLNPFDITEEKDTDEMIPILSQYFK